jgi:hypothetical protein
MDYLISKERLELLLEKEKENIGKKWNGLQQISVAFSIFITLIVSDCKDIFGITGKQWWSILCFVCLAMFVWGILLLILTRKKKLTPTILTEKIISISELLNEPRYIIIIQNDYEEFPNKYLVYTDPVWKCYLCIHYPFNSNDDEETRLNKIKRNISRDLHIEINMIENINYIFQRDSNKYSYRVKKNKLYFFYFYHIKLNLSSNSGENIKNDFTIDGKEYSWKSINELEQDPNTQDRNSDVIKFLKEFQDL